MRISGQSFIKNDYHKSRNSDDFDMKLGTESRIDHRNNTKPQKKKKKGDHIISSKCDFLVIFLVYSQFGTIWNPDPGSVKLTVLPLHRKIIP